MSEVMTLRQAEELFNLPDPYGESDVKSAYRKLILEKHPDVRKDVDKDTANREASEINAANKLLSNRFASNKTATFTRQKATSSYTYTRPQTSYRPQPQPQTTWTPQSEPFSTSYGYESEIPVEEITWEDLVNDFWEEYHAESLERRAATGQGYTFDDLKRDAAVSAFAWASRKVAQKLDGNEPVREQASGVGQAADQVQSAANNVYVQYEAEKRKINRRTGRIAVFFLCQIIAATCTGLATFFTTSYIFIGGILLLAALVIGLSGFVNLVFPFVTVLLRKGPYRRLDEKYEHVFRSG